MFTKIMEVTANNTKVTGTCSNGTDPATMVITSDSDGYVLTITDSMEKGGKTASVTSITLTVNLTDNANFPNASTSLLCVCVVLKGILFLLQDKVSCF
jgi:hypothetical protein